jgi:hypothetical protein
LTKPHINQLKKQHNMQKQIKLSDAMYQAAEAVVSMGKKAGVAVNLVDLYTKHPKEIALIARFLLSQVETTGTCKVEVTRT